MKEFVISEAKVETAVLVGLITQTQDERKTNEYLDELAFLAETAGAEVVKRFTQKLPTANWKRSDNIYGQKRKKNVKWEWLSLMMSFPRNKSVISKPN